MIDFQIPFRYQKLARQNAMQHNLHVQLFPFNGAMLLNGSSLLLGQNLLGQIEHSCSKITWILFQLPISHSLVQLLDGTD